MTSSKIEIGASEAAAPLGLSPYETPLQFWARKTGLIDKQPENQAMRLGTYIEESIAKLFADETGIKLSPTQTLYHPRHDWLRATPDRFIRATDCPPNIREEWKIEDDREVLLLEIKTTGLASFRHPRDLADQWGEDGSDHVPVGYATQVQTQIAVTDAHLRATSDRFCFRAVLKALIPGRGSPDFFITRNGDAQQFIVDNLERFYNENLLLGCAPDPVDEDDWKLAGRMVQKPMREKLERIASEDETKIAFALRDAKERKKQATLDEAIARAALVEAIGSGYALTGEWGRASLSKTDGGKIKNINAHAALDEIVKALPDNALIKDIVERNTSERFKPRMLRATFTGGVSDD